METNDQSSGIRLLKKGQKGIMYALFSRVGIMLVLLILQALTLFGLFSWFRDFLPHIMGGTAIFTVCMVLYLINSSLDPTAKITWLIVIMLIPVFGALLFWYTQSETGHRAEKKRLEDILGDTEEKLPWPAICCEAADFPCTPIQTWFIFLWVKINSKKCWISSSRRKIIFLWNILSWTKA